MHHHMWYGLDLQPINVEQAERLLRDIDARQLAQTIITTDRGQLRVSTVFLVHNHNMGEEDSRPILWETMTFGGPNDQFCERYRSRDDAFQGHAEAVGVCLAALEMDGAKVLTKETQSQP